MNLPLSAFLMCRRRCRRRRLIVGGFYLVKKGFARVEHRRNSGREPRVRSNLIPGRRGSSPARSLRPRPFPATYPPPSAHRRLGHPSFHIIRNNSSYLSSVSARYRTLAYVHGTIVAPTRAGTCRRNEPPCLTTPRFVHSRATEAICSGRCRRW